MVVILPQFLPDAKARQQRSLMNDSGPPDWEKFTQQQRENFKLSHSWTTITLLKEIRNLLTFIGCAASLAIVLYLSGVYWH